MDPAAPQPCWALQLPQKGVPWGLSPFYHPCLLLLPLVPACVPCPHFAGSKGRDTAWACAGVKCDIPYLKAHLAFSSSPPPSPAKPSGYIPHPFVASTLLFLGATANLRTQTQETSLPSLLPRR